MSAKPISYATSVKTLLIFASTLAVGISYWLSPASSALQRALEHFLAWATGGALYWITPSVSMLGTVISVSGFTANIVPACTGLFTITIFVAAVLAYPCTLQRRALGVVLGIVGILTLNWVRIISLMLIGAYWNTAFEFAHLVVWQSLAVFFAAFLWLLWVQRIAHAR